MTDTVDGVEDERPGDQELQATLERHGEGAEGSGERGRLEVPAEEGSDQVGGAEGVEAAGEDRTGDTCPDGAAEPCLALVVNLQMGCYGTALALGGEERLGIGFAQLGGGHGSDRAAGMSVGRL